MGCDTKDTGLKGEPCNSREVIPVKPVSPVAPVNPEAPVNPVAPIDPLTPVKPVKPATENISLGCLVL